MIRGIRGLCGIAIGALDVLCCVLEHDTIPDKIQETAQHDRKSFHQDVKHQLKEQSTIFILW